MDKTQAFLSQTKSTVFDPCVRRIVAARFGCCDQQFDDGGQFRQLRHLYCTLAGLQLKGDRTVAQSEQHSMASHFPPSPHPNWLLHPHTIVFGILGPCALGALVCRAVQHSLCHLQLFKPAWPVALVPRSA